MALVGIGCLLISSGVAWLAIWLFVVGACSGALYPLGLALLGERTPPQGMSRAGAWFLAINCLGSVTGPVVAGKAMDRFGRDAMFVAGGAAIVAVFAGWAISALLCRERRQAEVEEPVHTRIAA
jgi:MFS family permease